MRIFLDSMQWNPQVLYRVHKTPLLAPAKSQMNPVHTILLCLRYIVISSHPCRVFMVVFSFQVVPPDPVFIFFFSPIRSTGV